ncbi:MAG: trypsin-like peptidase domain-containing protein, partial [Candidatus Cloacimonetes bacterium]|nr:trypsin-like peptidase domain-containing protein [Candidatus Cloacimonadota bacterium]
MRKNDVILILAIIIIAVLVYTRFTEKPGTSPLIDRFDESTESEFAPEDEDHTGIEKRRTDTDEIYFSRKNAITNAVEKIQPAVVSVNVIKTKIVRRRLGFFFGFYDEIPYNIKGIGSGVIFNEDGYIITNAHVVEGATEIKIILTDNRQFDGKLMGIDSIHDIAILKIKGKNLPFAKLGNSSELIIGEWAIAVGNPYGFLIKDSKPSVSVGVISAVNRDFAENEQGKIYRRMIQTDAAINQGNSGGPLVNIYGEVVGINTFIFSETGGSIGIGFSIPIDRVKKVADELIKYGKIREIWFGFKVQDINPLLASHFKLESLDGVLVNYVQKNAPAYKAGLKKEDVIIEINGNNIRDTEDAELVVSDVSVGDKMKMIVIRNGKKLSLVIDA